MERLKTKVSSLAYSLEDDYVDDSKEFSDEILKDNDCEVPGDDDEVVECVETEKDTKLMNKVKIRDFVSFGKANERIKNNKSNIFL